jgi:hypothetical protein
VTRYEADLELLATQLARMAADATAASAATDPAAVDRARLALRQWCRAVLDDVAPAKHAHITGHPGLADLAHRPIGVLRALLGHDPHPFEPYPSLSEMPLPGEYAANEQWQNLLGAAEVASHEWSSSDPASRPTGEQAWATVADVAAIAEAGALLDRDLAAGHPDKRGAGWTRDGWEIAVAAGEVRQLAASGPLLSATSLRPAPHRLKPVSVRSIDTLAPALASLAAIVAGAKHLGPGTMGALAATHAKTVRTLAGALAATGPPAQRAVRKQLATSLDNHADALVNVQVAGRPLQSLEADDPRPALQMQEIRGGLHRIGDPGSVRIAFRNDQTSLLRSVGAALAFGPAMSASANAHIHSGRWLQPTRGERLGWEKVSPDAPIAEAAMLVQGQAHTLAGQIPRPRPTGLRHRTPHELLPRHLLYRDRQRGPSPLLPHAPAFGDFQGGS